MPFGWRGLFDLFSNDNRYDDGMFGRNSVLEVMEDHILGKYTQSGNSRKINRAREAALRRARESRGLSGVPDNAEAGHPLTAGDENLSSRGGTTGGRSKGMSSPDVGSAHSGGGLHSAAVSLLEDWYSGACRCSHNPKLCGPCRLDAFNPAEWQTRSQRIWQEAWTWTAYVLKQSNPGGCGQPPVLAGAVKGQAVAAVGERSALTDPTDVLDQPSDVDIRLSRERPRLERSSNRDSLFPPVSQSTVADTSSSLSVSSSPSDVVSAAVPALMSDGVGGVSDGVGVLDSGVGGVSDSGVGGVSDSGSGVSDSGVGVPENDIENIYPQVTTDFFAQTAQRLMAGGGTTGGVITGTGATTGIGVGSSTASDDVRSSAIRLVADWRNHKCRCDDTSELCGPCGLDAWKPYEWQKKKDSVWQEAYNRAARVHDVDASDDYGQPPSYMELASFS